VHQAQLKEKLARLLEELAAQGESDGEHGARLRDELDATKELLAALPAVEVPDRKRGYWPF
jgi:hypothetical protein